MDVQTLYKNGLLFLNNVIRYPEGSLINRSIVNPFFAGIENKTVVNTLMYYQKFGNINTILKLIVDIILESSLNFKEPLPIEVDVLNASRLILPPHIYTEVMREGYNATIGLVKIVIPIHTKMDTEGVLHMLKTTKTQLKNKRPTEEILKSLCKVMDVTYSFPVSDQRVPFIFIDSSRVVNKLKWRSGSFTTTTSYRVAIIGTNIYTESLADNIYSKKIIDTTQPSSRDILLEVFNDDKLIGGLPVLMEEFIEEKGKVIQV